MKEENTLAHQLAKVHEHIGEIKAELLRIFNKHPRTFIAIAIVWSIVAVILMIIDPGK